MMKTRGFLGLATLVWVVWTGTGVAQQGKVPPEIWEKARVKGVVRVIVGLNMPWRPEGKLSQQDRLAQREAIAAVQSAVLAELAGTKHRVTRRFDNIPSFALEVGPDALAVPRRGMPKPFWHRRLGSAPPLSPSTARWRPRGTLGVPAR
jgi:hypothetical protein